MLTKTFKGKYIRKSNAYLLRLVINNVIAFKDKK